MSFRDLEFQPPKMVIHLQVGGGCLKMGHAQKWQLNSEAIDDKPWVFGGIPYCQTNPDSSGFCFFRFRLSRLFRLD